MLGIVTNRQLQQQLTRIELKVDLIMTEHDQVNAAALAIQKLEGVA